MKPPVLTIILASLPLLSFCAHPQKEVESVIYHPPVVFTGVVNDDHDSLPGNPTWPNTCELLGDTVRMYFHSENFHVANDSIWHGDLIRLTLLPNANDSLVSTRSVFLHAALYRDMNYSYDVAPRDSVDLITTRVEMRVLSLSRTHGSRIEIDGITVLAKALTGNRSLIINNGRISGTIE